jgi:mono/diheme cytochrome c family protein
LRPLFAALLFACACSQRAAPAVDGIAWARVVAALQQIGEEHHEALELEDHAARDRRLAQLAAFADATLASLPRDANAATVEKRLRALRARLLSVDWAIATECQSIASEILAFAPVERTPQRLPDLANGGALFARNCAVCHNADGSGRAPGVATLLDPQPPNILHPSTNWTPFEMYNRVTFGGVETAMPSFAEGLAPAERWDIVFWLFAERWPPCKRAFQPIAAAELATSGDFELGKKFGYGAAACLRREFVMH